MNNKWSERHDTVNRIHYIDFHMKRTTPFSRWRITIDIMQRNME
jgi:hypothetical protein